MNFHLVSVDCIIHERARTYTIFRCDKSELANNIPNIFINRAIYMADRLEKGDNLWVQASKSKLRMKMVSNGRTKFIQ